MPPIYVDEDTDLVSLFGTVPGLSWPIFLVAHKDVRKRPRVAAFFEFCLRELKPGPAARDDETNNLKCCKNLMQISARGSI